MTPDEILERTQWDLFWLPSTASSVDRPELAYSHSPVDRTFLNCVVRTRLSDAQVPAALHEVRRAHRGVRSRWMVTPGSRPVGIERALAGAGYRRVLEHRAAVLRVDAWRTVETAFEVRRVEDRDALSALYDVVEQAFGHARPDDLDEEVAECAPRGARVNRYVVYDRGRPVAAGGLNAYPALRFGLLWAGGTAPDARGRGAYRALLQARMHEARRMGLDAVGLYARVETSLPIVTRLGFGVHGATTDWERAPEGDVSVAPGTPRARSGRARSPCGTCS